MKAGLPAERIVRHGVQSGSRSCERLLQYVLDDHGNRSRCGTPISIDSAINAKYGQCSEHHRRPSAAMSLLPEPITRNDNGTGATDVRKCKVAATIGQAAPSALIDQSNRAASETPGKENSDDIHRYSRRNCRRDQKRPTRTAWIRIRAPPRHRMHGTGTNSSEPPRPYGRGF